MLQQFKKYLEKNLHGVIEVEVRDISKNKDLLEKVGETKTHCFICKYKEGFSPVAVNISNLKKRHWNGMAKKMNKEYKETVEYYKDIDDVMKKTFTQIKEENEEGDIVKKVVNTLK